ncbi:MAG: ABC transporter ATP-binding protein, partial [Rickettsiales bacterium]|nr:ABC transporter ATP-binding protein [Rickettsiales bacterium]
DVCDGEIFGLIGLNGAGKTTLIKIILDLLDADSGECLICGKNNKRSFSRENIFYLPERFHPPQNLKVGEFFQFFVEKNRLDLNKLTDMCENLFFESNVLVKKISNLSKGMAQKVGLVASVIENKKLIILDEPMSGLDPKARIYLKNTLKDYKGRGNSIFFSSHVLADVDEMCDRIAVLNDSKIGFIGSPESFRHKHQETSLERAFLNEIGETDVFDGKIAK